MWLNACILILANYVIKTHILYLFSIFFINKNRKRWGPDGYSNMSPCLSFLYHGTLIYEREAGLKMKIMHHMGFEMMRIEFSTWKLKKKEPEEIKKNWLRKFQISSFFPFENIWVRIFYKRVDP